MNIFLLSECMQESVQFLCNKHIVKMPLESAQMLSTVVRQNGFMDLPSAVDYDVKDFENWPEYLAYKISHLKHPQTVWTGICFQNYEWHMKYALAMCAEYTYRYNKICKSERVIKKLPSMRNILPEGKLTDIPLSMPDEYKKDSVVSSYREFYRLDKMVNIKPFEFKNRQKPEWLFKTNE